MFLTLFLCFTVLPAAELYLLVKIGGHLGAAPTAAIVVLMGILGATLARREGFAVVARILEDLRQGRSPSDRITEGLLVLVGSILLITPGVITDVVGFLFLVPMTRRWLAPRIRTWVLSKVHFQVMTPTRSPWGQGPDRAESPSPPAEPGPPPFDHPVA